MDKDLPNRINPQRPSDETPGWIGFNTQQELADEQILAEVVKEVFLTLYSRGVSRTQAIIEAYHTAGDLVKQHSSSAHRSPLAQVVATLHIVWLAIPPMANHKSFPSLSEHSMESVNQEPLNLGDEVNTKRRLREKRRGKRSTSTKELANPPLSLDSHHQQMHTDERSNE